MAASPGRRASRLTHFDMTFEEAVAASLGQSVRRMRSVSGGDVADAYQVWLEDGSTVFAKTKRNAVAGFFVTEADSLAQLRASGTVVVPEVLAVSDDPPMLILEWIDPGQPSPNTARQLGESLAQLHQLPANSFGRTDRRTTGSRGLPNEPCPTWAEFYATQRLVPLAEMAASQAALPPDTVTEVLAIADRLNEYGAADEPPALVHGEVTA